jgi:hypothetical protein
VTADVHPLKSLQNKKIFVSVVFNPDLRRCLLEAADRNTSLGSKMLSEIVPRIFDVTHINMKTYFTLTIPYIQSMRSGIAQSL